MHGCSMFLSTCIKNCGFSKLRVQCTQNVWVFKIVGTQNCRYLVNGSTIFFVGTQNFKFVFTKICGYSKFVGTCTQNFKFVGS